jgi:hypothetical protein
MQASSNASCSRQVYKNEAVEMTVATNSCDDCFEFVSGEATICLLPRENIKEV